MGKRNFVLYIEPYIVKKRFMVSSTRFLNVMWNKFTVGYFSRVNRTEPPVRSFHVCCIRPV